VCNAECNRVIVIFLLCVSWLFAPQPDAKEDRSEREMEGAANMQVSAGEKKRNALRPLKALTYVMQAMQRAVARSARSSVRNVPSNSKQHSTQY